VVEVAGNDLESTQASDTGLQGNGHHNHGTTGNVLIGGVEMLLPLDQVRLLAPLPRPASLRLFEAFARTRVPTFFFGNHSAIYGPDEAVPLPAYGSDDLYYALEIGCVIGRTGRDIAPDEAADYIAGYTIVNNWQTFDPDSDTARTGIPDAKAFDFATSLGPWLVTPDELEIYTEDDGHLSLSMVTRVNSIDRARSNMILAHHTFATLIAYASRDATLYPGDVLCSGKAETSGLMPLERGDVVELEVTGLGILSNQIT
jgi:fumarylacetoacetate (FAA) hydrolase